jgi:protein TonB
VNAVIVSDRLPAFPGGEKALFEFIQREMRYPREAVQNEVQGTVYVRFVVDTDGSLSQATVVRGIGFGCDEEALRIVRKMPAWIPGILNGQAVPVYSSLAVDFRLL